MEGSVLIYGANGYTGELVAEEAWRRGLRPLLAGRDPEAVARVASRLGLPYRVMGLEDETALVEALSEVELVLHCAGPFSRTWKPMMRACLRTGRPYLDINGELSVFEALHQHDAEARRAGVMLLPGVGCDVVPTDCLAAHLQRRLPGARRLVLAFAMTAGPSRGTASAMLEMMTDQGAVRQGGALCLVPPRWKTRAFDFGDGTPRKAITVPWGDLCTAWLSTGIPDIEVYGVYPTALQPILQNVLQSGVRGPSAQELAEGRSYFVGEVEDDSGHKVVSRLSGPNAYTFTARAAVLAAEQVLQGRLRPGFQTPSRLLGAEFALKVRDVSLVDLP
jgi:short subunit dehydrogenase-like uncharacterized protein